MKISSSASLTMGCSSSSSSSMGIVMVVFILSLFISLIDAISISHTKHSNGEQYETGDYVSSYEAAFPPASLSFPLIYKWSKRNPKSEKGCSDPTEPFQCPGSNICISLQFLCDGHANDCPNNYDEDQALCVSGIKENTQ